MWTGLGGCLRKASPKQVACGQGEDSSLQASQARLVVPDSRAQVHLSFDFSYPWHLGLSLEIFLWCISDGFLRNDLLYTPQVTPPTTLL